MALPFVRLHNVIGRGIGAVVAGATLTACGAGGAADRASAPPKDPAATRTAGQGADLVLRWRMTGGFAGLGGPGSVPDFSLYADGRAVVFPHGDPVSTMVLREYRLKPEVLRRLLADARTAGLGRPRTAGPEQVADAMTLELTMGTARTRIIQPESLERDPAVRFKKRLDPLAWRDSDLAAPERSYPVERAAVLAGETGPATAGKGKAWPLAALGKGEQAAGGLCSVFTGGDAKTVTKLAVSPPRDGWRSQGKLYSARFRPMLPDETTCKDVASS